MFVSDTTSGRLPDGGKLPIGPVMKVLSPSHAPIPSPRLSEMPRASTFLRPFVVFLAAWGFSLLLAPHAAGQEPTDAKGAAGMIAGRPKIYIDEFNIAQRGDNYRVNIVYPGIGNSVADTELSIWALNRASTFIRGVESIPGPSPLPYDLRIYYEVVKCSDHVTSVIFTTTTIMAAAQPSRGLATFIYDLTTGRRLAYEDIFRTPEGLISFLSRTARKNLRERLGPEQQTDMLDAGTTPERMNFSLYSLSPHGLVLHFPPGQVAPVDRGYLWVAIPLADLSDFRPYLQLWGRPEQQ